MLRVEDLADVASTLTARFEPDVRARVRIKDVAMSMRDGRPSFTAVIEDTTWLERISDIYRSRHHLHVDVSESPRTTSLPMMTKLPDTVISLSILGDNAAYVAGFLEIFARTTQSPFMYSARHRVEGIDAPEAMYRTFQGFAMFERRVNAPSSLRADVHGVIGGRAAMHYTSTDDESGSIPVQGLRLFEPAVLTPHWPPDRHA